MPTYRISYKPSVEKDLRKLPHLLISKILEKIETLKENPFPRNIVRLAGSEQLYRMRIGDYRVIYGVDNEDKQIIIHYIRHRREIYRSF